MYIREWPVAVFGHVYFVIEMGAGETRDRKFFPAILFIVLRRENGNANNTVHLAAAYMRIAALRPAWPRLRLSAFAVFFELQLRRKKIVALF